MPVIISIPRHKAVGTLDRSGRSFTPHDTGGLTLFDINVDWRPNQRSGPVSFSFSLNARNGSFPAGDYHFAGHIKDKRNPCPDSDATACGTVNWPGAGGVEDPWQASGGPVPEEKKKHTKKPPAKTKKPYGK
ncbi:MAG TPA: hypothetical protein VMZ30_20135 [Pyrinomonadaceae bacterium]|nr:hypothetical protein [Pyrinomonadaceae bacterium]